MRTGVLAINFGEPEAGTEEAVVPFLEQIFLANARLEGEQPDETRRLRSRQLALARAPALMTEYDEIGGSPLNAQARHQARALEAELRRRGHDVTCQAVFQFLEPSVEAGVRRAREEGAERLVALPIYPLCGQTTTVAALQDVVRSVAALGWDVSVLEVGGWHLHPDYLPLHAEHVRASCEAAGIDLLEEDTRLLFSIHGTPLRYLEAGSRYDRYVEEACAGIAGRLGVETYAMGYQNHTNRPVEWTEPAVDDVVDRIEARRLVVVAPSFMHEQSETLSELDRDLRARAEARGMAWHRVPIPHDDPTFARILADLVEGRLAGVPGSAGVDWRRCLCRPGGSAWCTNGLRLDPSAVRAVSIP